MELSTSSKGVFHCSTKDFQPLCRVDFHKHLANVFYTNFAAQMFYIWLNNESFGKMNYVN